MASERRVEAPWILNFIAGDEQGRHYTLTQPATTIGRGAGQDLLLNDVAASRRHAVITREGDTFRVTDLGSANGIQVNGGRVASVLLAEGDVIRIGTTVMRLERAPWWEESLDRPPPPPVEPEPPQRPWSETVRGEEATAIAQAAIAQAAALRSGPVAPPPLAAPLPPPVAPPGLTRDPLATWGPAAPAAAPAPPPPSPPTLEQRAVEGVPNEEFREVKTALTRDAVLPPLPELPSADDELPDESQLSRPIVAERQDEWRVTVGDVLSAFHQELVELIEQCSGLTWGRGRLVAASANADFVAFIDPETLNHKRVELPRIAAREQAGLSPGAELQIEAVLAARDYRSEFLLAFGSGSHDEARRVVRMRVGGGDFDLAIMDARWLYRTLLTLPGFATSTLNIEGAALIHGQGGAPPRIRLCQRGNGRRRGAAEVTSATVEILQIVLFGYLERCRRNADSQLGEDLVNVRRYDLGRIADVPLGFTDACGIGNGRMLYVALAERCIDAGVPGRNFGTALGVIEADGSARWTPIREPDGTPTLARVAALTVDDQARVYAALQATDTTPARLCRLEIEGLPLGRG